MVRAVEEGSKRPSKSLKGSKLRRTSNLTFSKTFSNYILENHRIRDKYVQKYFYTFRINQVTFTYGERKKELFNFYGMFSQSLPISAAFTAILKMKLPQCNAIGVRTPPGMLRLSVNNWTAQPLRIWKHLRGKCGPFTAYTT